LKVQYVNSILSAVKHVFLSMLDLPVKFENPITKNTRHPTYALSSIIGITGHLNGCIVISYPSDIAIKVASEMHEKSLDKIDAELIDALCEITNMVTGVADTELEIEDLAYSLPVVSQIRDEIAYPADSFVFSMSCVLNAGEFEVDIALFEPDAEDIIHETENIDR
jgi:chemotaxis protein CheX